MANLGFDDEVAAIVGITGSSVGWATAVVALLRKLKSDDPGNPFGTAALKDVGTAQGNLAELGAQGRFDAARLPAATETGAGIVELATLAEARTGTDTTRAVTPAGAKDGADPPKLRCLIVSAGGLSTNVYGNRGIRTPGNPASVVHHDNSLAQVTLLLDNDLGEVSPVVATLGRNTAFSGSWNQAVMVDRSGLASTTNKFVRLDIPGGFDTTSSAAASSVSVVGWGA